MAKVLAAVPKSGLEAVLVAVELVLESGNPSAEHVENVLQPAQGRAAAGMRGNAPAASPRRRLPIPGAMTACARR